ncbi:hypothetical protein ACFQ6H_27155 [Rhodococcus sp. NPDC056506]|uniref:hypothetical protein n=1 Tax=Rhodococcus sp. NPDC056506 TaxID=3345844 RepID=UPI00366A7AB6
MNRAAKKNRLHIGKEFAVLVIAICGASLMASCGDDDLDARTDARVACQDAVEARMKSPSTAKFGGVSTDGGRDSGVTVTGYVDAQNTFGASKRTDFACLVDFVGDSPHVRITGLE